MKSTACLLTTLMKIHKVELKKWLSGLDHLLYSMGSEIESQCHVKVCLGFFRYQHSQKIQGETLLQREKAEKKKGKREERREDTWCTSLAFVYINLHAYLCIHFTYTSQTYICMHSYV